MLIEEAAFRGVVLECGYLTWILLFSMVFCASVFFHFGYNLAA